jgi:hypothetical protein
MQAASTGLPTEPEHIDRLPLSPELVLVSPDLRELALREISLPHERNGVKPQLDLLELARERPREEDEGEHAGPARERPFLYAAAAAVLRSAVVAASFVVVVAAAAFGLTIAPPEKAPRLAPPVTQTEAGLPAERAWRSAPEPKPPSPGAAPRGIGTAALHGRPERAQRTVDVTPRGLLIRNLNALAEGSQLRLSKRRTPPVLRGGAVPLKLGANYISCGRKSWIAAGRDWALACEQELPKRRR